MGEDSKNGLLDITEFLKTYGNGYVSSGLENYADITKITNDVMLPIQAPITELDLHTKMLLFARWITTQYGTPEYNVNGFDGSWWKEQLNHFNAVVYPNMLKNGSVDNTKTFLTEDY